MSKILIALGGNALGKNPSEQLELVKRVSSIIVSLVEMGNYYSWQWTSSRND